MLLRKSRTPRRLSRTPSLTEAVTEGEKNVVYRNIGGGVRFVGSEACASCHQKIYKDYMRTPMAGGHSPANVRAS